MQLGQAMHRVRHSGEDQTGGGTGKSGIREGEAENVHLYQCRLAGGAISCLRALCMSVQLRSMAGGFIPSYDAREVPVPTPTSKTGGSTRISTSLRRFLRRSHSRGLRKPA